jgi:hypothetical protein
MTFEIRGAATCFGRRDASTSPDPPSRLGILCVHGVGEQRRGQVLTGFGDPLISTLEAWLNRTDRGSIRPIKGTLAPAAGGFEPAHAVVHVDCKGAPEGTPATASWLLTESWWAGDFEKPPFTKLAGWLLTTGAWAILIHAARPAFRRPRSKRGIAVAVMRTLLAIPLAWLLQIVVVLVSLLAWVPVPKFRLLLSNLLLRLSGTLGDSYVFLESPIQRAAAIETTRASLAWVADRSEKVVVLAHSQGAAIAYDALKLTRERDPQTYDRVKLFLTFGSGISKLTELEATSRTESVRFVRIALLFALYCLVTGPRALQNAGDSLGLWSVMYGVAPLMMLTVAIREALRACRTAVDELEHATLKPVRWLDFYSSRDPVPNGPLRETSHDQLFTSVEVVNRRSVVSDHTSYWDNRDEFVLRLLREIDGVAETNLVSADDLASADPPMSRRRRVAALSIARLAAFAGLPVLAYALRDLLSGFGASLLSTMAANPLTETIAKAAAGAGKLLVTPFVSLGHVNPATMASLGHGLVAASILVLIVWIWYTYCTALAWAAWDRQQFDRLCQPHREEALLERYGPALTVSGVAAVPLLMGLAAIRFPQRANDLLQNSYDLFVAAYPLAFGGLMLALVVGLFVQILLLLIKGLRSLMDMYRRVKGRSPDANNLHVSS